MSQSILSALVLLPVLGAIFVAVTPRENVRTQKLLAMGMSLVVFGLSLWMLSEFQPISGMQFEVNRSWLPQYGISYHIGVDGLSLWLIILSTFLTPISLLASWNSIDQRVREFNVFMLLLEAGMIGVFVSLASSSSTSSGRRC